MQHDNVQPSIGHNGGGSGKSWFGNKGSPMGTLLTPCLQEVWRYGVVKGLVANRAALPADLPCTC